MRIICLFVASDSESHIFDIFKKSGNEKLTKIKVERNERVKKIAGLLKGEKK